MQRRSWFNCVLASAACCGIAAGQVLGGIGAGSNVDVSTIPPRDSVQLTIYNSEDITLVTERRHVTFKPGINGLQFSWAGTLIDPTSVQLRFRSRQDGLELMDTTFPYDKPQMLTWNVKSAFDGEAEVEIAYFTSGLSWAADYVCVATPDETHMAFDGFVRITNNSGEDYADAHVRLVVGTINLVEKVVELAQRGIITPQDAAEYRKAEHEAWNQRPEVARIALVDSLAADLGAAGQAPKEIIKQGLSEYFIYTIEGTETIRNAWSKRMRLFQGMSVPFSIAYRWRPEEYGNQLSRLFLLRNDTASGLGSTPLPDGIVRLYRDNGRDGLGVLVQQQTKYVPIGQEIVLNLGSDSEVVHERLRLKSWRDEFWFSRGSDGRLFNPERGERIEPNYSVAGWNDRDQWAERIRNTRSEPIEVEFRLAFNGDVLFTSPLNPTLFDIQHPVIRATIAPGQVIDLNYEVCTRQGVNAKQNRVELAARE